MKTIMRITLRSGKDPYSGIQFSREIRLFDHSSRVHIDATVLYLFDASGKPLGKLAEAANWASRSAMAPASLSSPSRDR